ncbi:uncharacterized protein LOC128985651 [Macrosteles quadrilineatus]|uniref:uncharacterized protein LOC128985651 n=1 Tax=Macrosteles quadrilineatus TaxID=74068 RepID=UPI0023E1AD0A|nr:uncharacterized protein LOC128985651 [Macrosteles quadrilineatus]
MPRSKSGVTRKKISKEILEEAVKAVLDGKSLRKTANEFSINKSTLWNYVKTQGKSGNESVDIKLGKNDTKKVFTEKQETELVEYLETAARLHYGLTKRETRVLAFEYASINKIKCPEQWGVEKIAGKEWMRAFLKRWTKLSLRKPEATSLARATSFNAANVKTFFDNYKTVLSRYKFKEHQIFNLDETGNSTVHNPPKIIAPKGVKQIGSMTSGERGANVTMIGCINAAGNHVPPMYIFPRVNFKQHMINGAPPGSIGGAHITGWSTEEIFVQYLDHFIKFVKPTKDDPVLMILDNHESHISIEAINKARASGIVMLTFPPHTSHKLQPLDRTVFGPYKKFYNVAASEWMLSNPGKPMTIYEVAKISGTAYLQAFTARNIISGFSVTGIHPLNENIFKPEEFLPSNVTDRPVIETSENGNESNALTTSSPLINHDSMPSTSHVGNEATTSSAFVCHEPTQSTISPHLIRPFPKALPRKKKPGKKKGKSAVMTDTPQKMLIEAQSALKKLKAEKKEKKKPANKKLDFKITEHPDSVLTERFDESNLSPKKPALKKKKKTRQVIISSSSEDEDFAVLEDSSDDSISKLKEAIEMDEKEEAEEKSLLENEEVKVGDFVLVRMMGKKTVMYYVAEIVKTISKTEFEVKYLKRLGETNKFFRDKEDIYNIFESEIERKLPQPLSTGSSERQVSQLTFSIDFMSLPVK